MASHSGRSFLNSCLKVPLDPCNNSPAPIYNRPRMYLGRLSITPTTALASTTLMTTKTCDTETDMKWSCSGIRSLTKFYDSIPDYREINHFTEEEFYSTLDTLRSTCHDLKIKSANSCGLTEDRCSTTSASTSSTKGRTLSGSKSKKNKKPKRKKNASRSSSRMCSDSNDTESLLNLNTTAGASASDKGHAPIEKSHAIKSCRKDLEDEVESFKKYLKAFETEFSSVRPSTSLGVGRSQTRSACNEREKRECKIESSEPKSIEIQKVPVRPRHAPTLSKYLRKSFSFNDLHVIAEPEELTEVRKKNKTLEELLKTDSTVSKEDKKYSNYFKNESKQEPGRAIPRIIVDTPSSDTSRGRASSVDARGSSKSKGEYKIPFKVFHLDTTKKDGSPKFTSPSPVHPVARPNLAATLRAECAKKKVKELQHNCTYIDKTPQIDWEVRKTPAWKTLSLNETHKEILSLRLATRKAEQALQKREYELNMELMRQRVKSAPLLLEGPTYWGPHVGKLTHECQSEGLRHICHSNPESTKRKKNPSRKNACRRSLFLNTPHLLYDQEQKIQSLNTRVQDGLRTSQKINTLKKIYGGNSSAKSNSRCSNHSSNTVRSSKKKPRSHGEETLPPPQLDQCNDSGDELSSLDRAFL